MQKNDYEDRLDSDDNTRLREKEIQKEIEKQQIDSKAKMYRLKTAKLAIKAGFGILALCLILIYFNLSQVELVRDIITVTGSIITLALGFIAGSNIE